MSYKVSFALFDSSETMTMLGQVLRAHSRARWEGSLPISLMKYQYLTAEALSVNMLPISCEYTFEALSKPIAELMYLWWMLPSTVPGITITRV